MNHHKMHTKKRRAIDRGYGFAATGATLLLAAANGHAQSLTNYCCLDNLYVGVEAGGSFAQEVDILDGTGFNGGGGKIKFQSGWTVDGVLGYKFCDYFSAEFESGVIWNNITAIGGQQLSGVASAHLDEVPVLANGIFTYPLGNFKPFVGFGVGGAFGFFSGQDFQSLGGPATYRSMDATAIYQFEIGASYALLKNLDLGVQYRFVATSNHDWNNENITLKTSGTLAHLLEARVTWRF